MFRNWEIGILTEWIKLICYVFKIYIMSMYWYTSEYNSGSLSVLNRGDINPT